MKILVFCLVSALAFPASVESAGPRTYTVKPGDTLSQIAQTYIGSPVYPSGSGSLDVLMSLNPSLQRAPAIFPGQVLFLRAENSASAAEPARELASQTGEPAPSPVNASPEEAPEVRHRLVLSGRYGITTVSATDAVFSSMAKLFSKRDIGFSLGWRQEWSESFSTVIQGSLRDIDFEPPTNSAKTLSSSHKTLTGLEFEAKHAVSDKLQFLYRLRYESRLFVRGANTASVVVDAVPIPEAGAEIHYQFLKRGSTTLGLTAGGGYLFAGSADSYAIRSGYSYSGGILIGRHSSASAPAVSLGLAYQNRTQNTANVKLRESSVVGTLNFGLAIFDLGAK